MSIPVGSGTHAFSQWPVAFNGQFLAAGHGGVAGAKFTLQHGIVEEYHIHIYVYYLLYNIHVKQCIIAYWTSQNLKLTPYFS